MHTCYAVGSLGSGKTHWLTQHVAQWPCSQRLILAANSQRKAQLTERLRHGDASGDRGIYTYSGWVRTCLFDHWPRAEAQLAAAPLPGKPVILPELSSYRDSEALLHGLVQHLRQQRPDAFAGFIGDDSALVRQLLRRLRQRSENRLTRDVMRERSEWLEEPCIPAVSAIERLFDRWSYQLRLLDPSKQLDMFHQLLTHDPAFLAWMVNRVRFLAVDDWDETTPAQHQFVQTLLQSGLQAFAATCDPDGGSRRGYLNAYPYDWPRLVQDYPGHVTALTRTDAWAQEACTMLTRWKSAAPDNDIPPESPALLYARHTLATQEDQLATLWQVLQQWQSAGIPAGDIAIAVPEMTPLAQMQLKQGLQGWPLQWLSGTATPFQHPVLRVFVLLLQWLNQPQWQAHALWHHAPLTQLELRDILRFWQHPLWQQGFDSAQLSHHPDLAFWQTFVTDHADLPVDDQLLPLFRVCVAPYADTQTSLTPLTDVIKRYASRFLPVHQATQSPWPAGLAWVISLKQGRIAETPAVPVAIDPTCLVIGTPQKLVDAEVRRSYYVWLDCAHPDWHRTDNAPLYDAWVHSAAWQDGLLPELAPQDLPQDEWLVRVRAAHICRNLMLLIDSREDLPSAQPQLVCLSSEADTLQRPLAGLLPQMLPWEVVPSLQGNPFTLRSDQSPVLDYTHGTMAISAVPGAGKTFVTVALILHLISQHDIQPERLLVLTFMDSAAKTLLGRLRPHLGSRLPQVSTIHSLAYRMVRHGNHAHRLGLDIDTLTILDETAQQTLLQQVAAQTLPATATSVDQWVGTLQTGLNRLKARGQTVADLADWLATHPDDERVSEFEVASRLYRDICQQKNLLDFNDLIQLSIRLLTEHDDVRQYYQRHIHLIIEDEAQDSSAALQTLLKLLGGDTPNLIRTGDSNQSISATFSAADASVFRQFIQTAQTAITMDGSGRCAAPIMALANQWVNWCTHHQPELAHAFIPVTMTPVADVNPALIRPIQQTVFDTTTTEQQAILADIQAAILAEPDTRKALLVRTNFQAGQWIQMLVAQGTGCVSAASPPLLTETLAALFAWLHLLREPDLPHRLADFLAAFTPLCPEAADLQVLIVATSALLPITRLNQVSHPLAQKLYYDWLDISRSLVGNHRWLVRVAHQLFIDPRAQHIVLSLADKVQATLQATSDPSLWLCDNQAPLSAMLRNLLKRQQEGDIPPGHVLVTTMHTAKGQEYDWVWMPELTSANYPFTLAEVKKKERSDSFQLEVSLARLNNPEPRQAITEALRRDKLEEEARLLYVGLTRARRSLWLSAAEQGVTRWGKPFTQMPHPLLTFAP
jgi:DNA helicase II / ATP-dependent DNA helicase PcrA